MNCANPFIVGGYFEVACGYCLLCKSYKKQMRLGRLLLEHSITNTSLFLTLTYNDDNVPRGTSHRGTRWMTLCKKDMQDWIKRVRYLIPQKEIRYQLVGEYGPRTERPHYHAILFGLTVDEAPTLENSWKFGFTQIAEFNTARAAYVINYLMKSQRELEPPSGCEPEFRLQSCKPALGMGKPLEDIIAWYYTAAGAQHLAQMHDICETVRIEGKRYPLDYTMRQRIRERLGLPRLASDRPSQKLEEHTTPEEIYTNRQREDKLARAIERKRLGKPDATF